MNREKWSVFWIVLLVIMVHKSQPQDTPYAPVNQNNLERLK